MNTEIVYVFRQANAESDKFNGVIPMNKLDVKYSRSSGPGGQNVNKLETKVDVRFHVATADWIPKETRERFLKEVKCIYAENMLLNLKGVTFNNFILFSIITKSLKMDISW